MAAVSSEWCLEALNSNSLLCFEIKAIKECDEKVKVEVHYDCRLVTQKCPRGHDGLLTHINVDGGIATINPGQFFEPDCKDDSLLSCPP